MHDFIKFVPVGARLSRDVAASEGSLECLATITHSRVKPPKRRRVIVTFLVEKYAPLKLIGDQMEDGGFLVVSIEVVLPAMLHGHNGRLLRSDGELFLALTIVQHLCGLVLDSGHSASMIPGVGAGNLGFIRYLECAAQINDPSSAFLRASHLGRLRNQQTPSRIYLGQSTKHSKRGFAVSVYDKLAETRHGIVSPAGAIAVKVETQFKSSFSLAKAACAAGAHGGARGDVLASITSQDSYRILRAGLEDLVGFSWAEEGGSPAELSRTARIIVETLGNQIGDPRRLEIALAAFKSRVKSQNTFRKVEAEIRAFACRQILQIPASRLPANSADLEWVDVCLPEREAAWAAILKATGAPTEPDPAIVDAWSRTSFLSTKPETGGRMGSDFLSFMNHC